MLIKVTGVIQFEPENVTKKHDEQSEWKRIAMINVDDDTFLYYSWFLKKRFHITLNKPIRGTHVTFISDKFDREIFDEAKLKFDSKPITFYHELEPRSNGDHWWLRVHCHEAEDIREFIGLERDPFFGLHLTLGHPNEKNLDHSRYILEQCKRYELISNEPKAHISTHIIWNELL